VVIGVGVFLVLSVAVSLALAAILGWIGAEVSRLIETEVWTDAPLEREALEAPRPVDAPSSLSERGAAARRR
jgi:cytochrome P450